jgi:hypothetical protein
MKYPSTYFVASLNFARILISIFAFLSSAFCKKDFPFLFQVREFTKERVLTGALARANG